jgi:diacylglycerol kinase (ATP)
MPNARVPVAFLPSGRGKDSARTLPSLSRNDLLRTGVSWRMEPMDVGVVTLGDGPTRYFINISSIGLGATAARIATRLPRLPGTATYLVGAAAGLVSERHVTVQLRADGQAATVLERCRIASVANGRYFGGGLQIAPMASAQDGLLEIVTVSGAGRIEILRNLPRVFRGTHMTHPAVHHWTARCVAIEATPPVGIETDGEVIGRTPATFTVLPGALPWAVLA